MRTWWSKKELERVEIDSSWHEGLYHRITLQKCVLTVDISKSPWAKVEQSKRFYYRIDDIAHFNLCLEYIMGTFLSDLRANAKKAKLTASISDDATLKKLPNLCEFFSVAEVEGEARKTGTANIFFDAGQFKVFLNDRDTNMYLCVSSESLLRLLEVAEKAIASPQADWRAQKPFEGSKSKKKGG